MDSEPVAPILVELTELFELVAGLADPEVEPRRFAFYTKVLGFELLTSAAPTAA